MSDQISATDATGRLDAMPAGVPDEIAQRFEAPATERPELSAETKPGTETKKLSGDTFLAGISQFFGNFGAGKAEAQTVKPPPNISTYVPADPSGSVLYEPGDKPFEADELDAGGFGLAGVEDSGDVVRRFY
ncbi:MAG: hypothetical protein AAF264_05420, partial [Pseudomonadota bacterium]